MDKILLIYSTTDGHTRKICHRLKQVIEEQSCRVTLISIDNSPDVDLNSFDKIVLGASIRYGKHNNQVYAFINRNQQLLNGKPNAFFTVNVVARKPGKNRPDTNPYLIKFLNQTSWQPKELAVFAGKIDYKKYSFRDRQVIRLIMWITKGPTDLETVVEFTDWNQVEAFAKRICDM